MPNKANFIGAQMNVTSFQTQVYGDFAALRLRKNKAKQSRFTNAAPETCVPERKTTIRPKIAPDFTAEKSSFLYNILLKRNRNDSSVTIYLSNISVVLSPMNVTSSFNPSAVWQPISENITIIKTASSSILLAIPRLLKNLLKVPSLHR